MDVQAFRSWAADAAQTKLLFVNDGSTDETAAVLKQVRSGYESAVSVLELSRNSGKAEAVRQGILKVLDAFKPRLIGYWDADLATPLNAAADFVAVLTSRPDIEMVFGSRVKLLGRYVERKPMRHYLGRVFATAVSNVLRLPIYDTQCGAKIFRVTKATAGIFGQPFLSRWIFDVEIIARYLQHYGNEPARLKRVIYEFPLMKWVDVGGSKVRPTDFFTAFVDIWRIRRRYLSGRRR